MTPRRDGERGFTLIETLLAAALMATILVALATLTAQWLPNWNRGLGRVQQIERLAVGLDRLARDVGAALFVPLSGDADAPMFEGSPLAITFVRSAVGLNAEPGLEVVRLIERAEPGGLTLMRESRRYRPVAAAAAPGFVAPVALIPPPWRVRFAYRDAAGAWREAWSGPGLPRAVRIAIRDGASERVAVSVSVALDIDAPAACVGAETADALAACLAGERRP